MTTEKSVISDSDEQPRRKAGSVISTVVSWVVNLCFFALILGAVIVIFVVGAGENGQRSLFGYSAYIVLSGSMEQEIPKGSLVLVKTVETETIQIGDDITFIIADNSLVTHRVVDITENYERSGMRGFTTQGVENESIDKETVYADNVVGKVTFHSLWLGDILAYVKDNPLLVILGTVLIVAFFSALHKIFRAIRTRSKATAADAPTGEDKPGGPGSEAKYSKPAIYIEPGKALSEEAHN